MPLRSVSYSRNLKPLFKPKPPVFAQLRVFGGPVTGKAWQYRAAIGRKGGASLRNHERIGQRLGHISKQFAHLLARFNPRVAAAPAAVLAFDIGAVRDAQHGVMCVEEIGFRKKGGIGGNQRNIARISKVN